LLALGALASLTSITTPEEQSTVYRVWGGDPSNPDVGYSGPWGHYWTTVDPGPLEESYRAPAGLPEENLGRFLSVGLLTDEAGVTASEAIPLLGNPGGLPELFVPDPQIQIMILEVLGLNPPF
jgi:hypothetical protein